MENIPNSVTVVKGIKNKLPDANVTYAPGPWISRDIPSIVSQFVPDFCGRKEKHSQTWEEGQAAFEYAVETAAKADVVIMVLGETSDMSGEAASRASIGLPGRQEELLKAVYALGKPVVLVVLGGRPLSIVWAAEHISAIVEAWQLGWEGGNAIVDVLFGDVNPSGKLPMTIPRSAGQCPKYYGEDLTHTPAENQPQPYSRYWNESSSPLYPFGYGLSYSKFEYNNLCISREIIKAGETVEVSGEITNTGRAAGAETAQLYIHQRYGSDSRPKRLLKGFERVVLNPGETKRVVFALGPDELSYWSTAKGAYMQNETVFDVWVGTDSQASMHGEFRVE